MRCPHGQCHGATHGGTVGAATGTWRGPCGRSVVCSGGPLPGSYGCQWRSPSQQDGGGVRDPGDLPSRAGQRKDGCGRDHGSGSWWLPLYRCCTSLQSDIGADTPKLPDSYLESLRAGVAKSVNAAVLKTAARKGLRVQLPPPAVPIDSNPREMPQCAVLWTNARCYGGAATW